MQRVPAELWIGEDGVARRMRMSQKLPGAAGAGTMVLQYSLKDFGAKLDAEAPPAGDTWDATSTLTRALRGGMSAAVAG